MSTATQSTETTNEMSPTALSRYAAHTTDVEVLVNMSKSEHRKVRDSVALNPFTPIETLEALTMDMDYVVSRNAQMATTPNAVLAWKAMAKRGLISTQEANKQISAIYREQSDGGLGAQLAELQEEWKKDAAERKAYVMDKRDNQARWSQYQEDLQAMRERKAAFKAEQEAKKDAPAESAKPVVRNAHSVNSAPSYRPQASNTVRNADTTNFRSRQSMAAEWAAGATSSAPTEWPERYRSMPNTQNLRAPRKDWSRTAKPVEPKPAPLAPKVSSTTLNAGSGKPMFWDGPDARGCELIKRWAYWQPKNPFRNYARLMNPVKVARNERIRAWGRKNNWDLRDKGAIPHDLKWAYVREFNLDSEPSTRELIDAHVLVCEECKADGRTPDNGCNPVRVVPMPSDSHHQDYCPVAKAEAGCSCGQ
ncbi:hypothetical protein ACWG8W_06290 [Citricoccus zhacaiensis]